MDYTLYNYWRSSCSFRVRIVLAIKNISYNYQSINLGTGQQNSEEFILENPMRQVPYLSGNGVGIGQSLAIIQYLEEVHPTPSVLPSTPALRAKMWEICEIINSYIQPLQNLSILNKIEKIGANKQEWAQEFITDGLKVVEKLLEHTAGRYSIGDQLTVADACLVPQIFNARRFSVDVAQFPHISRVFENLNSLPEIIRASPESQPDATQV